MSNMQTSLPIPFKPVRGKEEVIKNMTTENGYLYLATDTRKTYLGMENGEKILMGYDTGVFYGTKEIPADNSGNTPNPEVYFNISEIEGNRLPLIGDLILNVDGCFYRVELVLDADNIKTKRLTLQGTGGGGSAGGGSSSSSFNISFTNTSKQFIYSTEADIMDVNLISYYKGTDDNYLSAIAFTLLGEDEPFLTVDGPLEFNVVHTIDLSSCKSLFTTTNTSIEVTIYDKYGEERSDTIKVRLVTIALTATAPELFHSTQSEYTYSCHLAGATSGVAEKKITYRFYADGNLKDVIDTQELTLSTSEEGSIQKVLNFNRLDHGVYTMTVQASAKITGSNTILYSNILTHKVGYYIAGGQPLLMVLEPSKTEQYTNIPVHYLFVTDEAGKAYSLDIKLNNIAYKTLSIKSNETGVYNFYFEDKGTYNAQFTVVETGIVKTITLDIVAYTGNLPVIDPTRNDLMLYLTPRGKTNNDIDRDKWIEYNGRHTADLTGLHYGKANGWLMDDNGTAYLKLTSGAKLTMPSFKPFQYDPTVTSAADSRAGYGLTIELDFEINGILDFDASTISCVSYDKDKKIPQCGFEVIGDKIKMYNSRLNGQGEMGVLANQTLIEGERMRLSFVIEPKTINYPMCYTYLNGKLSGAIIYAEDDAFLDGFFPATLNIDSTTAQIKIYGIRFYSSALSDKVILNNYTTTFATLEERQNSFDSNNVFDANGKVNYALVAAEDYNLQIPYMKLTGGYKTTKADKWTLLDKENSDAGLPTGKKDYRLVDVEVIYPKNKYFENYNNYKFTNEFTNGAIMAEAYGQKPSNGGAIMYAQGTSSMEYPIKNLRLRFKKDKYWYTVRPDIAPVEIICMKADYMESSGSHNTGTANFVDALYKGIGIATPGQEHFGGEGKDTIVTCIKGHPCLIFYSESGAPGTYEYIGKYNLNLDKATPEPFGFNHDDSDFGYLNPGDEYYAVQYDDDGEKFIGQLDPTAGGDYDDTKDGEELKEVQEGEKINSIHCFEFLDNAVKVCNFLVNTDPDANGHIPVNYEETWYNTFKTKDNKLVPGWTLGFESRYPEDRIGYHDADMLYPLASWLNELYLLRQTDEALALARFKNEYECYLDKDFLLTYYLVTEALLMVDSRVKNMMIATWGRATRTYTDLEGNEKTTNFYKFYPIFYDMDTMLGLDNTGVVRFNYYDEDTDASIYNGEEVLWNFVRDALPNELLLWYSELENSILNAADMLPFYNNNQANMANEAFYNGDAMVKYITPAREGYHDDLYDKDIAPGAAPYLYAAQGDRSLMRISWLTDRIRFLRGKYNSGKFQGGDRIEFRWYYPSENDPNALLAASAKAVPPDGSFTFESLKTGYAGILLGANGSIVSDRFNGSEQKTLNLASASSANGTEAYLLGLSGLSDLGDLSNKYMQKFIIGSSDVRLKRLILGNPHKDYYNPYWNTTIGGQSARISLSGCTYLEEFNLQNCITFNNTLDFTDCPAINKILLTGSSVSALTLPVNGMLTELRLPKTITTVKIEGHNQLTDAGFSLGNYNYNDDLKIGGETGVYVNDFSGIKQLYIVDTPINSYKMAIAADNLTHYYLQGVNWTLTEQDPDQYCYRSKEEIGDIVPANTYYTYADGKYTLYEGTTYEAELYEKFSMCDKDGNITCIPILEQLQTKTVGYGTKHSEALSGVITINIPNTKVVELEIYEKYNSIYPNLEIKYGDNVTVEKAHRINFYRIDSDTMENMDIENAEPYFYKLTASNAHTLAELIADGGFVNPVKNQTQAYTYTFTGNWIDWADSQKTVYYQNGFKPKDGAIAFDIYKPNKDMQLVPIFTELDRTYQVTLYDYDESELVTAFIPYQEDILAFFEKGVEDNSLYTHAYYNYREYTNEAHPDYRWAFKGWQTATDKKANIAAPTYSSLSGHKVTSDIAFYAYYDEEDANITPSMITKISDYFDFNENDSGDGTVGASISLKEKYRYLLQGKITLPATSPKGTPIVKVADFAAKTQDTKFTHIYFENNAQSYKEIGVSAFAVEKDKTTSNLIAVYLPATITKINDNAFYMNRNLNHITLNDNIHTIGMSAFWDIRNLQSLGMDSEELPTQLQTIGVAAFYNAGPGIKATKLPEQLTSIPSYAFAGCSNINIDTFGSASNIITLIGANAFDNTGNNSITSLTIYCNTNSVALATYNSDSGLKLSAGGFYNYNVNIDTLKIYHTGDINVDYQLWELTISDKASISQTKIS